MTKKTLLKDFRFALVLVAISILVQLLPDSIKHILRYESVAVSDGQWWRIMTANFSHSNGYHLLLNMLGLLMIDYFYQPLITTKQRVYLMLFCMLANVFMLHLFMSLKWYVGMSGALHGYLLGCALISFSAYKSVNSAVIIVVIAKLIAEMFFDINLTTSQLIETNVIEESHLFGGLVGILYWLLLVARRLLLKESLP